MSVTMGLTVGGEGAETGRYREKEEEVERLRLEAEKMCNPLPRALNLIFEP